MIREKKIDLFKLIIHLGFITAIIFHYCMQIRNNFQFPYNSFLFDPNDQFMDFINVYKSNSSVYFPFANFLINLFTLIKPMSFSFTIFIFISITSIYTVVYIFLKDKSKIQSHSHALIFTFFTLPFLFLIDRANFESFVFIFISLFLFLFNQKKYFLSTIPLAMAISMKLFPILLLLLFFEYKKFKEIGACFIFIFIFTIIPIYLLSQDIHSYAIQFTKNSLLYNNVYVLGNGGLDFGHSLFGLIKSIATFFKYKNLIPSLITPYFIFTIATFVYSSYFIIYLEKVLWKKLTIIVIMFCLLPNVSADYKLIHFLFPILFYINDFSKTENFTFKFFQKKLIIDKDYLYVICFSFLLIPKNYRILSIYVSDGVYLNPLIMIIMYILIISSKKSIYN